jgi:hypothetical protein
MSAFAIGLEPVARQWRSAGWPDPGLAGRGGGSAHAPQPSRWSHEMNPSQDLYSRAASGPAGDGSSALPHPHYPCKQRKIRPQPGPENAFAVARVERVGLRSSLLQWQIRCRALLVA